MKEAIVPLFLNTTTAGDQTSVVVDISYMVSASFQYLVYSEAETPLIAGTLQIEVSNQPPSLDPVFGEIFWGDLPNSSFNVGGQVNAITAASNMTYGRLRATWTDTTVQTAVVTTVADVGSSLNSTYFLISIAPGGTPETDIYVWFNVDSGGVDPAVPGRQGLEIAIAEDDTAATIATAIETEFNTTAAGAFDSVVADGAEVTFVQNNPGSSGLEDGADPTGFTFATSGSNGNIILFVKGNYF